MTWWLLWILASPLLVAGRLIGLIGQALDFALSLAPVYFHDRGVPWKCAHDLKRFRARQPKGDR